MPTQRNKDTKVAFAASAGSEHNQGFQEKTERSHAGAVAGGVLTSNNVWNRYLHSFSADREAASTSVLLY